MTEHDFNFPLGPGQTARHAILRQASNPDVRIPCVKWRNGDGEFRQVKTGTGDWIQVQEDDLLMPDFTTIKEK